jgi:lysophospholipase L1-like esterase
LRQLWLGLLGLTATCARPEPVQLAHAEAGAKPSTAAAPPQRKAPHAAPPPSAVPSVTPAAPPSAAAQAGCAPGSLATFFGALSELKQGTRKSHVHVLWLGDSHTNADFLSGSVRGALRDSFGDGGPGFVRIGTKPYRHEGVKTGRDGAWNVDPDPPARRALQDDGVFGLSGTRAVPDSGASFSVQVSAPPGAEAELARFELSYVLPADASFSVELGGKKQRVDAKTPADVAASGIAHLALTAPLGSQLLLAQARGAPRLFGVSIERSVKPGVVLDTLGIDGARLETPLAWNEAAFVEEVARRAPELLVIAYGTNEAFDALRVDKYGPQLAELVGRVRRAAPQVSCLVLGPTDAPLGDGSVPRVAEVSAVLQKAAPALGCSFVSLQQLMGGQGSFAVGMKAKERLAQLDKLHLTPKGYQELGGALAKLLLDAYSAGRGDLP